MRLLTSFRVSLLVEEPHARYLLSWWTEGSHMLQHNILGEADHGADGSRPRKHATSR